MEKVYGYGLVCPATASFESDLDEALRSCGLKRVDANESGRLFRWKTEQQHALFFEEGDARLRRLPHALAATMSHPLTMFELELEETGPNDDDELNSAYTKSIVSPDGTTKIVENSEDSQERSGELLEDLGNTLHWYVEADTEDMSGSTGLGSLCVGPINQGLAPRLQQLATDIETAGGWTIQPQGDRWMARVEMPDGSRRLSMLTSGDLDLLADATQCEPTKSG